MGRSVILMPKGKVYRTNKPKCLLSQKVSDIEDWQVILEPLDVGGVPTFYWNKLDNGSFLVEGEGFVVDLDRVGESFKKHSEYVKKKWAYKSMKWIKDSNLKW